MVIRVLQKDAVVTIGFEVEGDVSTVARPEGREGYVGGLGKGYGVPDVSCGKNINLKNLQVHQNISVCPYISTSHDIFAHCRHGSGGAQL